MIRPGPQTDALLADLGSVPLRQTCSLEDLLRRPEISLEDLAHLAQFDQDLVPAVKREVQLQIKYQGYIDRQQEQVDRFRKMESVRLPRNMSYKGLAGLSNEVVEKLTKVQPRSLGQASRISGITPAAISVLQIHLRKQGLI
jgi:tRNA uridine 5-carboxymethylaminomethyl modification enzyme